MIGIQVFDNASNLTPLADWSRIAERAVIHTNEHGFEYLPLFVPMAGYTSFRWYEAVPAAHVVVSSGATTLFEGRVEDRYLVSGGLELGVFGYQRALRDAPYTALWSTKSVAGYEAVTEDDVSTASPGRYYMDNNNRVFIAPNENAGFDPDDNMGVMVFKSPDKGRKQIAEVTFSYDVDMPINWTAELYSYDDGWSSGASEWSVTSLGSQLTGSATVTFSTPKDWFVFRLYWDGMIATTYTGETGASYAKFTSIRVKAVTTSTLTANTVVEDVVSMVSGLNGSQLSSSTALIDDPSEDLEEVLFEDLSPAGVLNDLVERGDSQTPPARYEWGVWEGRRLHFRERGSAGRVWYVDVLELMVNSSLDALVNSAYGVYQSANGRTLRTDTADDSDSLAFYGLTRRMAVPANTTSSSRAETVRDAELARGKYITPKSTMVLKGLYDEVGGSVSWPLWAARSGDVFVVRNLPPVLGDVVNKIRRFRLAATAYDLDRNVLRPTPESALPSLEMLVVEPPAFD